MDLNGHGSGMLTAAAILPKCFAACVFSASANNPTRFRLYSVSNWSKPKLLKNNRTTGIIKRNVGEEENDDDDGNDETTNDYQQLIRSELLWRRLVHRPINHGLLFVSPFLHPRNKFCIQCLALQLHKLILRHWLICLITADKKVIHIWLPNWPQQLCLKVNWKLYAEQHQTKEQIYMQTVDDDDAFKWTFTQCL